MIDPYHRRQHNRLAPETWLDHGEEDHHACQCTVPFRTVRTVTGHRDLGLFEMSQMSQVPGRLAESTRIVVTNAKNASF